MADREELQKQYAYSEMSSKVLQADRRGRPRGEPTGEVESLRSKRNIGRMGDRVVADKPVPKKKQKPAQNDQLQQQQTKKSSASLAVSGESILELGNLTGYQPSTDQARAAYESILTLLAKLLGNQGPQFLRDAAEEVILTLKDETLRDPDRLESLSKLLTGKSAKTQGALASEIFTTMVQLGKQLDDYHVRARHADQNDDNDQMEGDMGVAVVFDEESATGSDNDNDGAEIIGENVVLDAASSDSEEEHDDGPQPAGLDESDEEKLVQGAAADEKKRSKHGHDRTLSIHEVDAHFLQRQLSKHFDDAEVSAKVATEVLEILDIRNSADVRECENRLLVLLGFDLFNTIKLVLHNRTRVWACVSMKRASTDQERKAIEAALLDEATGEGKRVWDELHLKGKTDDWTRDRLKPQDANKGDIYSGDDAAPMEIDSEPVDELDLDALAFKDGAHIMSNKSCKLPDASWRVMKKGYEEVHVPATRSVISKDEVLIAINDLPKWTHAAFKGMDKLNRIQSKMCDVALHTSENLLLCAPTGAGKTNVGVLTIMNILGQYRRRELNDNLQSIGNCFDLSAFKIVYVAPMKALVQEVVKNFSSRLQDYGITVRELSGDASLTRQQIAETQMIVTTPEKWDIVTRQGEGRAFTQLVKLVIIDEIHLLADERGPVLESIVSRMIRQVELSAEPIRLVGLSATLPNFADVAAFLRVKPERGLFFFDSSYRPVPLQMQYIGVTERNAFKRFQLQNEICYEKAMDQRRNNNQILIFVHSRAETAKTAKALRDMAVARDELNYFVRDGGATSEILREEASSAKNSDLKDVLSYGFAIHHAGMQREDRELVEDLFADRHIAVLCCTATLAWGVNVPAFSVIIRGTQIYDPSKGRWAELSPLDVLQMLGRAGRPQYDSEGEGIIITQHSQLQFYLSLTNLQLPIESQMIKSLANHLNAEVVLGTIQSIEDGVDWLSYTFLYVRMLQNPELYGISGDDLFRDPTLKRRRFALVHSAAKLLEKSHLIHYDPKSGTIHPTPLGRVASQYYISHQSMAVYASHMRHSMTDIDLLRLFSLSGEFSQITVREEEKLELSKLAGRVPIPVKESPSEPIAKVNILLQAYISRLKLDGFALLADMAFIKQSSARLMRALFEIALRRNWASLAKLCLDFSNMVSSRIWRSQTPLRQFPNVPEVVARKLERKGDIDWERYADLTPSDLGELVGVPKMGRVLHKLVSEFPRLELNAQVQPITRSMLRVELTVSPAFQFDVSVHGYSLLFHILVEDVNGESILHYESFTLINRSASDDQQAVFSVPILEPLPPAYFIRVISDRWLHSTAVLPVSFNSMILPAKFPPTTELLDLQPLQPSAVGPASLARLFTVQKFNPIQTQTFHELYRTDQNCLICAASGSGKSICAELAIIRMLTVNADGVCVYVAPTDEIADPVYDKWKKMFGSILPESLIVRLIGETLSDMELVTGSKIVVASAVQWDKLSRRWRQRKAIHSVTLMIFDELQFLGGEHGPTLEIVISRTRYMSAQLQQGGHHPGIRFVGLSASLANARDVGGWMGVGIKNVFNFPPKSRPAPLEFRFQSFEQGNYSARLLAMSKPVYNNVAKHLDGKSAMVFVPSRRQAQLTAIDLMSYRESQGLPPFLSESCDSSRLSEIALLIKEPALRQVLPFGIGFVYGGMIDDDWKVVVELYEANVLQILICPVDTCWKLHCRAHLVVIMGTEYFDGRVGRHVDYAATDLLHMVGRHNPEDSSKCVLLYHAPKKAFLKKLIDDPLPVESHIDSFLHDPLNAEVVSKTITSMQDAIDYMTWTFLYRRLVKNPTYYGLRGTTNVILSEHLSDMIETVVGDLEESKCIRVGEEGDITPLNFGMIAAYYSIQYRTIELFASSVTARTKTKGILEILSAAWEYSSLPMRYGEEKSMATLSRHLVHSLPKEAVFDSNTKALVLLQSHFSRLTLPAEMRTDLEWVLREAVDLIQALVDVISSNGWLKPALASMEVSQMIVQGLWNKENVLKQIPHFTDEIIRRCAAYKGDEPIESVFDILTLDDDVRNELLQLPEDKMADVAVFCNNYPNLDISYQVEDSDDVTAGESVRIVVELEREVDVEASDDELKEAGTVSCPFFPADKKEGWWVVVGDASKNNLMSLKRVHLHLKQKVVLEFMAPENAGEYELSLFCMSDSYLGCDQEFIIAFNVGAALGSDEDDEINQ
ncbi:hypothetical protein MPSEU_000206900 [Mayamaea pseudoterrestris]|nr:hypothetical protein MPSEU_000206900 [Mayamaea pseudoterrestris]